MKWLSDFVIRYKKSIIAVFLALTAVSVVLFACTGINYNIMDYLPEDANSTKALDLMEEEFDQPLPNLNVMAENVSLEEAVELKQKIAGADSVRDVMWLDDSIDLRTPVEMQDSATVETYYKDNCALFMVSVEDGKERSAISSIREACGDVTVKFSGNAADQASSQELAISQAVKAIIMLVPILIIILLLVTESYIEPVFYLLTLGTSVLLNLGSNIVLGEISFVTLAAAPILQMAVSLDYAVFLSHSYDEFKRHGFEQTDAIRMAIQSSTKSISASMLTTLFGFVALLFMQFRIGADMGISLVKGVLLSYLCAMVFLPALLLCGDKLIERTKHRRLIPTFGTLGKRIMKVRIPIALILLVVMVPAFLGQANNSFFYGTSESTPVDSEAYEIEQKFGAMNSFVVMVPRGDSAKETMLCQELKKLDHVSSVMSYAETVSNKIPTVYLSESIVSQFYSENYARIILSLDVPYEGAESFALVEQIRATADSYYPDQWYTCGQSANMYDMKAFVEQDNQRVNLITIVYIYLVLLLMTQNLLTPVLLILTIKCSIWLNMSIPYFTASSLCYLGYLIVSTVQMGATVDYAILLTNTYQEKRLQMPAKQAMTETLNEIFSSLLVSASTLTLAGFCLSLSSSNEIIQAIGILTGRGAILAIGMVMLFLPTLILLTDKILPHTGLRCRKKKKEILNHEKA